MNILFITLLDIVSVDNHDLYTDLVRRFAQEGHHVYIVSPVERRFGKPTQLIEDTSDELHKHVHILKLKTGNIQKTNVIEKGISTVLLESQLTRGIKRYFSNVKFNLVLYSTPPITVVKPVRYIKKRDGASTYLMLKDIFPQNAVDMGMMGKNGLKGLLYKHFRNKEKQLYAVSDRIGCMSAANVQYVLNHNPEIPQSIVELCPNCIEIRDMSISSEERTVLREKYGIPQEKRVFVYGGNLGKPQGIDFVIECLKSRLDDRDNYFLIVGDGTEYGKLEAFFNAHHPSNMKLMRRLPKEDYDHMIAACDVGMIFLDHRFTIPNYPSRLLTYMQAGLPVLAATDTATDIGAFLEENGIGVSCESNDVAAFNDAVSRLNTLSVSPAHVASVLKNHFDISVAYQQIVRNLNEDRCQ